MLSLQVPAFVRHKAMVAQAPKLAPSRLEVADLLVGRKSEWINCQVSYIDHGLDGSVDIEPAFLSMKPVAVVGPVPALQGNWIFLGRPGSENAGGRDSVRFRHNNLVWTEEQGDILTLHHSLGSETIHFVKQFAILRVDVHLQRSDLALKLPLGQSGGGIDVVPVVIEIFHAVLVWLGLIIL